MHPPTYYDQLQVLPTAEYAVIGAAYRALRRSAGADTSACFEKAHHVLSDPRRRAIYNLELERDALVANKPEPIRACWRCTEPLTAAAYCSACHWTVCIACRACGCENPDWLRARPVHLVRWPLRIGQVSSVLVFAGMVLLSFHAAPDLLPQAIAVLRCGVTPPTAGDSPLPFSPAIEERPLPANSAPGSGGTSPAQWLGAAFAAVSRALHGHRE